MNLPLSRKVQDWLVSTDGIIKTVDIYKQLGLSTRHEKKNISIILKRLVKRGLLKKFAKGHFVRVVEKPISKENVIQKEKYVLSTPPAPMAKPEPSPPWRKWHKVDREAFLADSPKEEIDKMIKRGEIPNRLFWRAPQGPGSWMGR